MNQQRARGSRLRCTASRRLLWKPLALAIGILAAARAEPSTTIVVNLGPHRAANQAGHSEARVNWLDADTSDDTVCTTAFAALELQHYLRKMTGREADFPIVADKTLGTPTDRNLLPALGRGDRL